jgi:mediator of RNA polymerase II transcription subunit 14
MLSAVKMDGVKQNGVRNNHDRDARVNGMNGTQLKSEMEKGKGKEPADVSMINGGHATPMDGRTGSLPAAGITRMDELPDEIQHITQDIYPLSLLLTRLAQSTHNDLEQIIGNLASISLTDEKKSPDAVSLEKKKMLLEWAHSRHAKWVKTLVITEWSRKSEDVGKLIDLFNYLRIRLDSFGFLLDNMILLRRQLYTARSPSPDLKTALQILEDGEASFLPEVGIACMAQGSFLSQTNLICSSDSSNLLPYRPKRSRETWTISTPFSAYA